MDEVLLAAVASDISLSDALDSFREGTSALVVRAPGRAPWLITFKDILDAIHRALDFEGNPDQIPVGTVLRPHAPVHLTEQLHPRAATHSFGSAASVLASAGMKSRYRLLFTENDQRYAIHEIRQTTALVVTASENFAALLTSSETICRCVDNPSHVFSPRELVKPGYCNKAHGSKVVCKPLGAA